MAFKANVGKDLDSSVVYLSSDGYFASQSVRAGLVGGASMHGLHPPNYGREAMRRKIMKERIRQEILTNEILERRALEEEVRRELQMERMVEMKRFQMERWPRISGPSGIVAHTDRYTQNFMPPLLDPRRVQNAAEFASREKSSSHLLQNGTMEPPARSSRQVLGAKRKKAEDELLPLQPPSKKQWGCALCEVRANSEQSLEKHLQGKKHKSKEASLLEDSKSPKSVALAMKKSRPRLRCSLCQVKCSSMQMLEEHLAGKRHKSFLELKKASDYVRTKPADLGPGDGQ